VYQRIDHARERAKFTLAVGRRFADNARLKPDMTMSSCPDKHWEGFLWHFAVQHHCARQGDGKGRFLDHG